MFKKFFKRISIGILILFIFLSALPYVFPTRQFPHFLEQKSYFLESKFIEIDKVWLHYRVFEPSQKPQGSILFIHGFSGSTFSWRKNVKFFQENGYQVLCVDLPAFGFSDRQVEHWNVSNAQRMKILWQLATLINPETRWHLVGHSMGASYVWNMAIYQPEKVGKVLCVGGLPSKFRSFRSAGVSLLLKYPPTKRWIRAIAENFYYKPSKFEKLLASAYSQKPSSEDVEGYLAPFKIQGTTEAILNTFENAPTDTISTSVGYQDFMSRLQLVWGENDLWVKKSLAEDFVKRYPFVSLQIISQAGHCPMETQAEEFNKLLLEFLRK